MNTPEKNWNNQIHLDNSVDFNNVDEESMNEDSFEDIQAQDSPVKNTVRVSTTTNNQA